MGNQKKNRIVCFGEIMLRLSPESGKRLFQNNRLDMCFGGAEANVAVSLANYGEHAVFVSKTPEHAVGQAAVNSLRAFGVDTSQIIRGGERLGLYFYEKGISQRASECIYDRSGSSLSVASPEEFDWDSVFSKANWFHFTGITPALSPSCVRICHDAVSAAKRHGVTVSCDLNYRSKLWSQARAEQIMSELCEKVDVCFANEEDAGKVFGIRAERSDVEAGKINKDQYAFVAQKLAKQFGFSHVAISMRSSRSASVNDWSGMLFDGTDCYYSREYHVDQIVDRVGSGDSFAAGMIFALLHHYAPQNAVEFAVAAAVLKHSIDGDYNRVSLAETVALAEGYGSGRIVR